MPCDHLIEIHNDTGNRRDVYIITLDNEEHPIEDTVIFNFCPICGYQLRQVTDVGGD